MEQSIILAPVIKVIAWFLRLIPRVIHFFTGKQMLVDTAGRVERFNKRFEKTKAFKTSAVGKEE